MFSGQTVAEIPSSRQYSGFTNLIPAINVQANDLEGSNPSLYSVFQIHGGRRNEGQVLVDGMNGGYQGMGVSGYVPEVGNSQEVVFSLSGGLGEATTGGPQMNIIGKQGGNRYAGSVFVSGTGSGLQGTNLDAAQMATGLTAVNSINQLWDVNPSMGGPIVRDKLWFFATYRYQNSRQNVASMWVNKNAGNPNAWTYAPDFTQQAIGDGTWKNGSARITWQATPRNKINAWTSVQYSCINCIIGGDGTGLGFGATKSSPEGTTTNENHPSKLTQLAWTSPVTSRLLLEANAQLGAYFWWGSRQKDAFDSTFIPVQENGGAYPGINYRGANWSGHTGFTNIVQGSASYVTGSHAAEVRRPLARQRRQLPGQLLQQLAAQVHLPGRRPQPGDGVRRRELASGTEAEHDRVVRAGSLDARATDAAGRTPLRAPRRLLPRSADGSQPVPAHRRQFPGAGRSA